MALKKLVTGKTCNNDFKQEVITFSFLLGIIQNKTTRTTKKINTDTKL